jgi:transposase
MDNLGSHRGAAVRKAIRAAGAKLILLPKYSPDLNPIEQVFAKLKHLLRKAAARTVETLVTAVGQFLDAYTPQECASYLAAAGYLPNLISSRLSYDFSRREGEKEPLGEGGCPLVSGEGRIGSTLTV